MVKVKCEKPTKKVKGKAGKLSAVQPTHSLPGSPSTRSNTASVRDRTTILDVNEQRSYKLWLSEIKQLQGLVICRCGLDIQAASYCTQTTQDGLYVRDFAVNYDIFTRDPLLGNRMSKIPLKFLTVGTSKATEVLNGEKFRKKYSAMKTYINNTLTPIYKR